MTELDRDAEQFRVIVPAMIFMPRGESQLPLVEREGIGERRLIGVGRRHCVIRPRRGAASKLRDEWQESG